ncbi:hypothetical protein [[Clostridium] hylemonae]|uniref:hypothetical protein n=1 Tax=[Clostridium] hylemonae TaxID=89153 RepID=UPI00110581B1|nr:hypothetical protein [[Clostridium] hylemonae]
MFDHFGIKDVFIGIWKYKWKIILASVIGTVIVVAICALFPFKTEKIDLDVGDAAELQMKTVSFYLDYQGSGEAVTSKSLSSAFLATMNDKACREYTVDLVLDKYSRKDIAGFMGNGITEASVTSNSLAQYVFSATDEDKFAIKLTARTTDEGFTETLLEAYLSWFKQVAANTGSQVKIVELSRNEQVVPLDNSNTKTLMQKQQWSLTKVAVMVFIVCVLLSIIGAFFRILFAPTLNRRSDFEAVGLTVLGEISIKERN